MNTFFTALVPISVLIALGFGLKRIGFLPDAAWSGMEKLTYFVLFPVLLVSTLGGQSFVGTPWLEMLIVVVVTLTVAAAVLLLLRQMRSEDDGAVFTSIFQGGVRFNTYITLAAAQGLYGAEGLAMASVTAGFMIVLINLMCIAVFSVWGREQLTGIRPVIGEVIGNPLIIACVIGLTLSLSGIGLPGVTAEILEIIGRAALPFGLLAVGASLRLDVFRGHLSPIVFSSIVQFGIKPLTVAMMIAYTGLGGIAAGSLIIAFIVPTAPSAYILARQLGGDAEAMASIITFQTLLAFLLMPVLANLVAI